MKKIKKLEKTTPQKLIILDRDGVINYDSDNYIKSPEEWIPIEGSLAAIAQLNKAGFLVAIATNQSGIARGFYSSDVLEAMHSKMHKLLKKVGGKIDYISYCPHGPDGGCACRKPKPGMLLEIAKHFSIEPEKVTFIGDSRSDMQAAKSANMAFILVKTGKGEKTLAAETINGKNPDYAIYDSLQAFASMICK